MAETDPVTDPVQALRWKVRLVLLTAPRGDDPLLREQQRLLDTAWIAMRDREMQVMRVNGEVAGRYGLDPARFGAALVGKDGEVKERWDQPREPAALFALVDGMPMRQQEMRR